jgi:glycosidase
LEPPEWFRQAVIYQVLVDRFAPTPGETFAADFPLDRRLGGTLWGLIERLDDLTDLGVDTLWLTPIFASPDYHGYAASSLFQVEPALGGESAWRELVQACRRRGLRLVLDFVANHVSDQHPAFVAAIALEESPTRSWFRFRHWPQDYDCFFNQRHQPEVDAENPDVREYLIEAAVHALEARCDGFRLDYAHGLSHGFWSRFRAATRAAAPDCASFGEITQTPAVMRSYAGRMDGCLDFVLCSLLRETFARGRLPLSAFARGLEPRESWNLELREFYRALTKLRREASPSRLAPELLWVDDGSHSAAWRIGNLQLVLNCGEPRAFSTGRATLKLTTFTPDASATLDGSLMLPAWSGAVLAEAGA